MPKGSHILMADDDKMLLDMYRERLELAGYKVTSTNNGEEALAKIRQEKPDLVMLDVMMPKADGYETLASIKSDPETKNIPVVMLSALMRDFNREKAIESGADDYLIKSEAMPSDVITKIEQVLQKYGKGTTPLPGSRDASFEAPVSVATAPQTPVKAEITPAPTVSSPTVFPSVPIEDNSELNIPEPPILPINKPGVDLKPLPPLPEMDKKVEIEKPLENKIETVIKPETKPEDQTVSFEPAQQETIATQANNSSVKNHGFIETQPEIATPSVPTVSMSMVQPEEEPVPPKPKTSLALIIVLTILITTFINDLIMFLLFFMQK